MLPDDNALVICFAHAAYQLRQEFLRRRSGISSFEVRDADSLAARIAEADVLVVSGLWRESLLARALRLRFIQAVSAGVDQFDRAALAARSVRLASAQGANEHAVAEHAMALLLALARRLPEARDNQIRHHWRGMIADPRRREDELGGKTLLVVGPGRIGGRLARLAKAFSMHVIGIRRIAAAAPGCDEVHPVTALAALLPRADYVALTCPLTAETERLIDATALRQMKPGACLINCARGKVVDEAALIAALRQGEIAAAALDVSAEEPPAADSPLWDLPNLLLTPHTAGETRRYEENVVDLLMENLDRLRRGAALRNQVL
jgi:phosphoglycerate dehydrogenase-like enzyme